MRRNKARIPFVLQPGPAKGPDGKPLLYAQLDPTRKLSLNELELDIRGYANYSMGEFKRLFEVFAQLAGKYIAEGYRIVTPLGSFAPKLKMTLPATDPALVPLHPWLVWSSYRRERSITLSKSTSQGARS